MLFGVVCVGVGLGAGLARGPSPTEDEAPARESPAPRVPETVQARAAPVPVRATLDPQQEARLRALEQKLSALESQPPAAPPAPASPPARPESEAMKQAVLQRHREQLEGHQRQPIDTFWAQEAARSFTADFSALGEGQSFTVRALDCRSSSCVATLEWPSYAAATDGYEVLLHHTYGLDCARTLLLPEPEDETRSYQVPLLLDCQDHR